MFEYATPKYIRALLLIPLLALSAASAMAAQPTELRIAVIIAAGPDSAWDGTFLKALEAVKAEAPENLAITTKVSDPLWGDDAENAMRLYAQSGQFDIIWAHSSYTDQVKTLKEEFPDVMFVVTGSGNEGLGGNLYWIYKRVYEPAYLLGVLAGKATASNVLGVVGTYPADDVNDEINAFFAGAKSVNPAIVSKVAFIGSWYDPAKAAEFMNAQIAAKADVVFMLADNFAPCDEKKIVCIGNFRDDSARSPRILSAPLALWDADIKGIVETWYGHKKDGKPFAGNKEIKWLSMKDGGSTVADFNGREGLVPVAAITAFNDAKAKLEAGTLTVPLDTALPASN
ncbi:Basic membrane lipoprotein [Agrobacterium tumefaciens str. Kerr 14]|uniref:Basic membrane lipoprotein n=1 Tax=Agrobacterium tumefaciens str. Kerr 14 TaxID=1183424 RepID=A0A1S7SA04_AGRTU|nr:BMP family protein [Agrobacterium tumefaciens]CUX65143.1 Basic membrane lipoprotein [Agrobacterium tumefaciens str. Kerr 14]